MTEQERQQLKKNPYAGLDERPQRSTQTIGKTVIA